MLVAATAGVGAGAAAVAAAVAVPLELSDASNPVMSVKRERGAFVVNLDFQKKNQFKNVLLQIGIKNSMGKIHYKGFSSLLLDAQGEATVMKRATYAKEIYFRALMNKKVIAFKKIK